MTRIIYIFRPPSTIVDVVVCNNMVAIALSNNVLMRLDLSNPSEIDRKYAKILELTSLFGYLRRPIRLVLFVINVVVPSESELTVATCN